MADVLREYLVGIGFSVDENGLRRFKDSLKNLSDYVERYTTNPVFGMGAKFATMGFMAASALAAVDLSLVGLMSHVARSDLDMQIMARRMFMSTEAARQMKTATDALGVSLEDVIWGPPELRERYQQLIEDQRRMGLGQDWEGQMRRIRDVQFQFTRLWVEGQRFAMMFAGSLSKALFGDQGGLEANLQKLNEFVITNMPRLADQLANNVAPLLRDLYRDVLAPIFTWMSNPANWNSVIAGVKDLVTFTHAVWTDVKDLIAWSAAHKDVVEGAGAGAVVGGAIGGPGGAVVGGGIGAGIGAIKRWMNYKSPRQQELQRFADMAAQKYGINPNVFKNLVSVESSWNPDAVNPDTGAFGLTQFMPGTAKSYLPGGYAHDPVAQLYAGAHYLSDLLTKYHGDYGAALKEYGGFRTKDPSGYIDSIMGGASVHPQAYNPQIHINIQHLNATKDDLSKAVAEGLKQASMQRNKTLAIQFSEGYATNFPA